MQTGLRRALTAHQVQGALQGLRGVRHRPLHACEAVLADAAAEVVGRQQRVLHIHEFALEGSRAA